MAAKWGRPFFQGTGMAMYNEQEPARSLKFFDQCSAALRRGNGLYIQMPCQPLSFDFTMANAYPFYSHSAFDPIKAYSPEQLKEVYKDPSWREKFRENARNPRGGMIFQGNWDRIMVAVAQKARPIIRQRRGEGDGDMGAQYNAGYASRISFASARAVSIWMSGPLSSPGQ